MTPLNDPRTKKLAITIALCGIALITDRFVIGPPTEAAASSESAAATSAAVLAASAGAAADRGGVLANPERTVDPRRVLADRLRAAADHQAGHADEAPADVLRRVFEARPSWQFAGDGESMPAVAPVLSSEPEGRLRARFREQTRLTGVMHTSEGGGAWINGAFVPIGGVIDGFTLVATGPRSATFERGGEPLELMMSGPMERGRGSGAAAPGREPDRAGAERPETRPPSSEPGGRPVGAAPGRPVGQGGADRP